MPKRQQPTRFRSMTAIIGGILLATCFLWLAWILFSQHSAKSLTSSIGLPGLSAAPTPVQQIAPLLAQGITLTTTDQKSALSQQEALAIADQLETDAASKAKNTSARYALLTYPTTGSPATHPNWNDVAVWIIWYQHIPQGPADTAADSAPSAHPYHDLFVFLDANSGKELFSLWA